MDSPLMPIYLGVGTVVALVGIRAYHRRLLRRDDLHAHRKATIPLAVALVALLGVFYSIDSGVSDTTLFEAQVPGTGDTTPNALTFTVPVEHPGATHSFDVNPRNDDGSVHDPIDVAVRLVDPAGAVVVDQRQTLGVRDDSDDSLIRHYVWESWDHDLTPTRVGNYQLTVTVLSPDVPLVHVWVGDDDKTDGHRIAGYA